MPKKTAQKKTEPTPEVTEESPEQDLCFIFGMFEFKNKARYEGEYCEIGGVRYRIGKGKLTHPLPSDKSQVQEIYEGDWKDDKMEGFGKYRYANNDYYEGEFKENKHEGQGKYFFADGSKYFGSWSNHKMHGEGDYWDVNGVKWSGQFKEGVFLANDKPSLKEQKRIDERKAKIAESALKFKEEWDSVFPTANKKNAKEVLEHFFSPSDSLLVTDPAKFEDRPFDKLNNGLTFLFSNISVTNVVAQEKSVIFLSKEEILADQFLDPPSLGQVVEYFATDEKRSVNLALIELEEGKWTIYRYLDSSEKKK